MFKKNRKMSLVGFFWNAPGEVCSHLQVGPKQPHSRDVSRSCPVGFCCNKTLLTKEARMQQRLRGCVRLYLSSDQRTLLDMECSVCVCVSWIRRVLPSHCACLRCEIEVTAPMLIRDLIPDFSACVEKNITSDHNCLCKNQSKNKCTWSCWVIVSDLKVKFYGEFVRVVLKSQEVKDGSAAVSPCGSDKLCPIVSTNTKKNFDLMIQSQDIKVCSGPGFEPDLIPPLTPHFPVNLHLYLSNKAWKSM